MSLAPERGRRVRARIAAAIAAIVSVAAAADPSAPRTEQRILRLLKGRPRLASPERRPVPIQAQRASLRKRGEPVDPPKVVPLTPDVVATAGAVAAIATAGKDAPSDRRMPKRSRPKGPPCTKPEAQKRKGQEKRPVRPQPEIPTHAAAVATVAASTVRATENATIPGTGFPKTPSSVPFLRGSSRPTLRLPPRKEQRSVKAPEGRGTCPAKSGVVTATVDIGVGGVNGTGPLRPPPKLRPRLRPSLPKAKAPPAS
jgi:hypothetical protein